MFTDNPDQFIDFVYEEHPEQYSRMIEEFNDVIKISEAWKEDLYDRLKKELTKPYDELYPPYVCPGQAKR